MTNSSEMQTANVQTETNSKGPDWNLVPFDVPCARCGHDLRGLTDPVCPGCKLEFDWSVAVPIEKLTCGKCDYRLFGLTETRCPECGERFTWENALAAYERRRHLLFEYRWRDRPVRSLMQTAYLSFRPKQLWRHLDIHDRPRTGPLMTASVLAVGMVLFTLPLIESAAMWVRFHSFPAGSPPLGLLGQFSLSYFLKQTVTSPFVYIRCVHLLAWVLLTGAALLMLRQSMKRCRILPCQVFRVWAYCVPWPAAAAIVVTIAGVNLLLLTEYRPGPVLSAAYPIVLGVFLTYLLREGYRRYLKIPHAWGVAIAAHFIGFVGSTVLMEPLRMLIYS